MRRWIWLIAAASIGCGTDNGGDVIDAGTPILDGSSDTDGGPTCYVSSGCPKPTFECIHQTILRDPNRCSVCHDPSVNLGSFGVGTSSVTAYAVVMANSAAIGAPKPKRVVAGMPSESWMYIKFLPNPVVGTQMPQTGPLRTCEIEAVETWITNGAQQD